MSRLPWLSKHREPASYQLGEVVMTATALTIRRGSRTVISNVDLQVHAGELLILAGQNGAGKSSLLGALTGDLPAASGTVTIDGQPLASWSPLALAQRRSLLPQHNRLAFNFTAEAVIAMGRAPWQGTSRQGQDEAVIAEVMTKTDVAEYGGRFYNTLSGGEQGRVALARVLAQQTGILLLDEPTAALDLHHQELVLQLARERAEAGTAVVVVLHDLTLAAAHADRVALLHDGQLTCVGPPAQVFTEPLLSKVYRHNVEVLPHPHTGKLLIAPRR